MMLQESTFFRRHYYQDWFLSGFDFGLRQNGQRVMDVGVPLWAKGSTRLFILIHRQVSRIRDKSWDLRKKKWHQEKEKVMTMVQIAVSLYRYEFDAQLDFLGYYIAAVHYRKDHVEIVTNEIIC